MSVSSRHTGHMLILEFTALIFVFLHGTDTERLY
jgi:hypothetical protein